MIQYNVTFRVLCYTPTLLERLDLWIKIVVFALHAFENPAQHRIGIVPEFILMRADSSSRIPAPRKPVVIGSDTFHFFLILMAHGG